MNVYIYMNIRIHIDIFIHVVCIYMNAYGRDINMHSQE
jgi:hypothetical protein